MVVGWFRFSGVPVNAEPIAKGASAAPEVVEDLGQWGGQIREVLKSGDIIIVGHQNVTHLYNGSDLSTPTLISTIQDFTALAIAGNYLYGPIQESETNWAVWDISVPLAPVQVGTFQPKGRLLESSENYLIFNETAYYFSAVVIYGLGNPTVPQEVSRLDYLFVRWAELEGDRLYVGAYDLSCDHGICTDVSSPLRIIDLSDPANPSTIGYGSPFLSDRFLSTISDGYLYQQSWTSGEADSIIVNQLVQSPAGVTEIATIDLNGFYPSGITVYDGTLYTTDGFVTKIYDVSNPATPVFVDDVAEVFVGVVYDNYLYNTSDYEPLINYARYITIYDLTTPTNPTMVTTIFHIAGNWAQRGANNLLFVADPTAGYSSLTYLHTVDVTVPTAPRLLRTDTMQPNPNGSTPTDFHIVRDNYLYVTRFAYQGTKDGVDIYRLPTATTPLEYIRTLQVDLRNTGVVNNAFLVLESRELDVWDTIDPENPYISAQLIFEQSIVDMVTEGNYAYMIEGGEPPEERELLIMDVALAYDPLIVGRLTANIQGSNDPSKAIANGYLYYPAVNGVAIADVRNPAAPIVTSVPIGPDNYYGTYWTDGERLYMADSPCQTTFYIYSLENPTFPDSPSLRTIGDCSRNNLWLVPDGDFFYTVTDEYGLRSYQFIDGFARFLPTIQRTP